MLGSFIACIVGFERRKQPLKTKFEGEDGTDIYRVKLRLLAGITLAYTRKYKLPVAGTLKLNISLEFKEAETN